MAAEALAPVAPSRVQVQPEWIRWRQGYPSSCFQTDQAAPPSDDWACSICLEVICRATGGPACAHRHCGTCITLWSSNFAAAPADANVATCPQCRASLRPLQSDVKLDARISATSIQCVFAAETRCAWRGALGLNGVELVQHLADRHGLLANLDLVKPWVEVIRPAADLAPSQPPVAGHSDDFYCRITAALGGREFAEACDSLGMLLWPDAAARRRVLEPFLDVDSCLQRLDQRWCEAMDRVFLVLSLPKTNGAYFASLERTDERDTAQVLAAQRRLVYMLHPHRDAFRRDDMKAFFTSGVDAPTEHERAQPGYVNWFNPAHFAPPAGQPSTEERAENIEEIFQCLPPSMAQTVWSSLKEAFAIARIRTRIPRALLQHLSTAVVGEAVAKPGPFAARMLGKLNHMVQEDASLQPVRELLAEFVADTGAALLLQQLLRLEERVPAVLRPITAPFLARLRAAAAPPA